MSRLLEKRTLLEKKGFGKRNVISDNGHLDIAKRKWCLSAVEMMKK